MRASGWLRRLYCPCLHFERQHPHGVLTRIATRPYEGPLRCCGVHTGGVYIDALALHYDQSAWAQCFLAQWPAGSDAHTSYWARIQEGPSYTVAEAVPAGV